MTRKSKHTEEYAQLLKLLVEERRAVPVSQVELGKRLPFPQPVISKIERGERRLDVIELRMFCQAIGTTLPDFIRKLEARLAAENESGS